jgi:hypothetical protein
MMIHTGKTVDRHSAAANRHLIATNSGGNRHFIAIGHMGQETLPTPLTPPPRIQESFKDMVQLFRLKPTSG